MKRVKLTQGFYALVDDEDYEYISQWNWVYWRPRKDIYTGYAIGRTNKENGHKTIWLHRKVTRAEKGQIVDHINGNGLDNRRSNLRLVSSSLNTVTQRLRSDNSSGFRGVSWKKSRTGKKNWGASIGVNGKRLYLGLYYSAKEAALAYNQAALEHYGEFAKLNEL